MRMAKQGESAAPDMAARRSVNGFSDAYKDIADTLTHLDSSPAGDIV
jgi:hypothetical protein